MSAPELAEVVAVRGALTPAEVGEVKLFLSEIDRAFAKFAKSNAAAQVLADAPMTAPRAKAAKAKVMA